jgi:hypothetical protein
MTSTERNNKYFEDLSKMLQTIFDAGAACLLEW